MKLLLIILFLQSSCINDSSVKTTKDIYMKDSLKTFSDDSLGKVLMSGEWSLCSAKTNNTTIHYNICPRINFNNDGKAKIIKSSGEDEIFNWKIINDTICISYALNNQDRTFTEYQYKIIFTEKKDYLELELRSITKEERSFFLGLAHSSIMPK